MSKLYTKTITTPTGKRKYIRAATKEELERKYQQAKLEIGAGVDITDATTFGEFAQLGLTPISGRTCARTVRRTVSTS